MKKLIIICLALAVASLAHATKVRDDMTFEGPVTISGDATLSGTTTFTGAVIDKAETVTAANVITAAECGKTFILSSATEFQSTLPALSTVSAGCKFRFVVGAAPSGASYTVITGNSKENKIYGLAVVNGASVAGADEDTITFADGAAVVGDWVDLESDGSNWYVSGQGVAAGAITLTQAD